MTYIDNQQKVYKFKYYLYIMLYYNKIEIPVHTAHNILHTQIYIETKRLNKITITF